MNNKVQMKTPPIKQLAKMAAPKAPRKQLATMASKKRKYETYSDGEDTETSSTKKAGTKRKLKFKYTIAISDVYGDRRSALEDVILSMEDAELFDDEKGDCKEFTHLVVGGKKRTLKVLYACAREVPIINESWLLEGCLKAGEVVPVKNYLSDLYAPRYTVEIKQVDGVYKCIGSYDLSTEIIQPKGLKIFLFGAFKMERKHITELVQYTGCIITIDMKSCDMVLFDKNNLKTENPCKNINWFLDCITKRKFSFSSGGNDVFNDEESDDEESDDEESDDEESDGEESGYEENNVLGEIESEKYNGVLDKLDSCIRENVKLVSHDVFNEMDDEVISQSVCDVFWSLKPEERDSFDIAKQRIVDGFFETVIPEHVVFEKLIKRFNEDSKYSTIPFNVQFDIAIGLLYFNALTASERLNFDAAEIKISKIFNKIY